MGEHHSWYNESVWQTDWPHQVYVGQWHIFYGPVILHHILEDYLIEKCCIWDNGSVWLKDRPRKIYVDQWPIFHFALYHCHRLKLFLYIKKWHWPGVFVDHWTLAQGLKMIIYLPLISKTFGHPKNCCNYPKIWLYHRVMSLKDADGMANSVDPDQTAPQSDLGLHCSSRSSLIWVNTVCPDLYAWKLRIITVAEHYQMATTCNIIYRCL